MKCAASWVALAGFVCVAAVLTAVSASNSRCVRLSEAEKIAIRGGAEPDLCPTPCVARWVSITEYYGAIECDHSPKYDPDCKELMDKGVFNPLNDCWELNGGRPAQNGKRCDCFVCREDACATDMRFWVAWCGLETPETCGKQCPNELSGIEDDLRQERNTRFKEGAATCQVNKGDEKVSGMWSCGRTRRWWCACKSSNCTPTGEPWVRVQGGDRQKCK